MRRCTWCGIEKPLSEFSYRSNGKPRSHCKSCASERSMVSQRKRRLNDFEGFRKAKNESKRKQVYRKYGLSLEDIDNLGELQSWRCYICDDDIHDKYYVDHNHRTGEVRKLLCFHCNVGLGHFKDSTVLLRRAIFYLIEHKD